METQALCEEVPDCTRAVSSARADRMIDFLRGYAENRVNSRLMDERRCIPPNIVLDLAREGMLGLRIEERYAGQALTYVDAFRVMEQASAVDPNLALIVAVHNAIGLTPVRDFALESVRREVLPQLASGRGLCTLAASEPGAAGNFKAISTRAVKRRDGSYVLNGEKRWISLGAWSEYVNLFAKLEDEQGRPLGITGFLVKSGTPGFYPAEEALTYGMKAFPQNTIRIENLRIAPEMLLGQEGRGDSVAYTGFMVGRLYVSVMSVGAMKRCLQIADRFARSRPIATGQLIDNGLTQAILNHCVATTRAVERLIYDVAERLDNGETVPGELYFACKVLASELMWDVVDRCVQMLGARGFLDTNIVGQYFRDFRLIRIFEGPTELVLVYLGRSAIKGGSPFVERLLAPYGRSASVQLLLSAFEELKDGSVDAGADADAQTRERHVVYAGIGDVLCRGILAAVMEARASTTGDVDDVHAARWCEGALRGAIRRVTDARFARRDWLPPAGIESAIAGYAHAIGDVEQRMAGEDRDLDRLLRS